MRTSIGQSPLIVNAAVEYANPDWLTARLSYLTTDRAIDQAGTQGIPDIFEERRDRLDFVLIVPLKRWLGVPLSTKLSVENILNDQAVYTQGGFVQRRFTEGVSVGFGLSYAN